LEELGVAPCLRGERHRGGAAIPRRREIRVVVVLGDDWGVILPVNRIREYRGFRQFSRDYHKAVGLEKCSNFLSRRQLGGWIGSHFGLLEGENGTVGHRALKRPTREGAALSTLSSGW
jgi:hypothetical protein